MELFAEVDWSRVLVPSTPLVEILVRGTVVYLALVVLLRVVLRRESRGVSLTDLLVVVLLADAAQNAMGDDYTAIPDGILLVATILAWNLALNWLGFHVSLVARLVHPPPLCLVKDGRPQRRNLRRELITDEELRSMLREQGVDDISSVRRAQLEGDGRLSVLTREGAPPRRSDGD